MSALQVWRRCQRGALFLVGGLASRPLCLIALLAVLALVYTWLPRSWLVIAAGTLVGLTIIAICGPEAQVSASTLARKLRFSYRQALIWWKWNSVLLDADLYKPDRTASGEFRSGGMHRRKIPKLKKIVQTPMGATVTANGRNASLGINSFGPKAQDLCTGFGCQSLSMRPDPDKAYRIQMKLLYDDPFKNIIYTSQLPPASDKKLVVVGLDEDAEPVEEGYALSRLVAGNLGSGKSQLFWRIMQAFVEHDIPWRCRMFDNKGGQEFAKLDGKAYYYAQNNFVAFLQDALNALAARQAELRKRDLEKCPFGDPELPIDVMFIDELVTAIATIKKLQKNVTLKWDGDNIGVEEALLVYLTQIRSAGFIVNAAATAPQKELIGLIRDTFAYKTCLRVGSAEIVRIMFAVDDAAKLYPAHLLSPEADKTAGVGWVQNKGQIINFRAAFVTRPERDNIVKGIEKWSQHYWAQTKHSKGREKVNA